MAIRIRGLVLLGSLLALMNIAFVFLHIMSNNTNGIIAASVGLLGSVCLIASGFFMKKPQPGESHEAE